MSLVEKLDKLEKLIPLYAHDKNIFDTTKKECDKQNAEIKNLMTELDLETYETEEYKVTKSVQHRQKLNEDILLDLFLIDGSLKEIAEKYEIIKKKAYVDMDVLEKAIYEGGLSNEDLLTLNTAMESKDIVTLRLSKRKKKEKEEDVY